jgi:phenylalanyl-tRNA synthetase beta chain
MPPPAFPAVVRDLSLAIEQSVRVGDILKVMHEEGGALLRDAVFIDEYVDKKKLGTKRSVTFRLTFRADDRTLTNGEVEAVFARIVKTLQSTYGAEVR